MVDHGRMHLERGIAHWRASRLRQALTDLQEAIEAGDGAHEQEIHIYCAWVYYDKRELQQSGAELTASSGRCADANLLRLRAELAVRLRRLSEAIADYSRLMELEVNSQDVKEIYIMRSHGVSIIYINSDCMVHSSSAFTARSSAQMVKPLIQRAQLYLTLRNFTLAAKDAHHVLKIDEGHVTGTVLLATTVLRRGDARGARDLIDSLSSRASTGRPVPEVDLLHGELHQLCEECSAALACYTRIIEYAPSDELELIFEARRRRASIYTQRNHLQLALVDYNALISTLSEESDDAILAEMLCERATVLCRVSQGNNESDALLDLTRAIRLSPKFAAAYALRGLIYTDSKALYVMAIRDLSRAIQLGITDSNIFSSRSRAHLGAKDITSAINDLNTAIEISPDRHDLYYVRGGIFFDKGEWNMALNDFSTAVNLHPSSAVYSKRLHQLQRQLSRPGAVSDPTLSSDLIASQSTALKSRVRTMARSTGIIARAWAS